MTIVLAHQGGWDEILMVAVPIGVFALLLYIANNRASRLGDGLPQNSDQNAVRNGDLSSGRASDSGGAGEGEEAPATRGGHGAPAAPAQAQKTSQKSAQSKGPTGSRPAHVPPPSNPRRGPI